MTAISSCPDEPELLSVATGEPTDEAIVHHVKACAACRGRVERLRAEVSALSRDLGGIPAPDPAVPNPAADPEGEPSGGPTDIFPMVRTRDLAGVCERADVLFAAVGRPEFVRGGWVKPGATVIDVGINRVAADGGKSRIVGDVCFAEACEIAGAITPVPGGVGPMTVTMLLVNTISSAERTARRTAMPVVGMPSLRTPAV